MRRYLCFPYAGYRARNAWTACRLSVLLALLTSIPYATLMLIWHANEGSFARHFVAGGVLTIITWALAARGLKHPVWDEDDAGAALSCGPPAQAGESGFVD